MKNRKMSTTITIAITLATTICISLLYVIASNNMLSMMKNSEMANLHASLSAQTNIIEEYLTHQEDLLMAYGKSPEVIEFLKDPANQEKGALAQQYTEEYYAGLDNWEGLYIGEWNSHVIAHSNPAVVGITTREGDGLKALQDAITASDRLYNAGIIVSPASQKLTLSLYCPVYDHDGKTMLGYVGGGPFAEGLKSILDSMENQGAKYSMLNAESGMYIFDRDESLMATEIKDETLLSIIEAVAADDTKSNGNKEYTDKELGKAIAAYQYISEHGWIMVSCNSEDSIYADANASRRMLGVVCVLSAVVIAVLCWILIRISTRPLKYVEKSILQLKNLKLEKQHKLDKYINGKSEIGQIATAIDSLYDSLKDIVSTLDHCSESLNQSAISMTDSSEVLVQSVEENSYTTEQFAKRTEAISDAVKQVDGEIGDIVEVVSQVEEKILVGSERSDDLSEKVSQMSENITSSLEVTGQRIEENKKAIAEAMLNLQSLTKIDGMAEQILDITSQTNLLSLNASIEAARAGEAGKGFAVVAGEIGNLASSSSETVAEIQSICSETKENIIKVQACFDSIVHLLQNDVQMQFEDFAKATNEYHLSIGEIHNIIEEIEQSSKVFVDAVSNIRSQIDAVRDVRGDSVVSTEEVMEKVEQIEKTTEALSVIVGANQQNAISIREIVNRFSAF